MEENQQLEGKQKHWQRYFFHIAYQGTHYSGWQRQLKAPNVQAKIEDTLCKIVKAPITIFGCGRTDTGVHASQYFFHVDIEKKWDFDLLFRLNQSLPDDIAIFDIIPVEGWPHARFDAKKRTYDYFIHTYKDPFLSAGSSLYLKTNLDFYKMKAAVNLLSRYNDFRAFCSSPDRYVHTRCKIYAVHLFIDKNGDRLRFQISADRFLGRMIRILVKKLLDIGNGKLQLEEFESYFITKKGSKRNESAYPQGLYLSKIEYSFLDVKPRTDFSTIFQTSEDWHEI